MKRKIVICMGSSCFARGNEENLRVIEDFLKSNNLQTDVLLSGRGAFRVHGGGFAGTVQAFVPLDMLDSFKETIEKAIAPGCCHVLSIRPVGGAVV